ncbi:MAG: PAS domain S-box protein [Nitrospirales bacterium]|nr:PAS domain S-box protein [Nitrospira sp.]MDR4502430.1 PAS domain S-box protein [Nitrospirales bacterium]
MKDIRNPKNIPETEPSAISETEEMVEALRQKPRDFLQRRNSGEEWEQAFNALTDQIIILDRTGIILWANKAVSDYFESTHSSLIGLDYRIPYYGTIHLQDPPPWETVLAGALSAVMETWLPCLKGWFLVSCYPLCDRQGEQWGVISVVKDITQQKRVEEALRDIAQGAPAAGSVAFFRSLVKDLSNALNLEYAILAEFPGSDKTQAQTVATWAQGSFAENFSWNLTPAFRQRVLSPRHPNWTNTALQEFPDDPLLSQWQISSFIGSPLVGASGQTIGLVAAMGKTALSNIQVAQSIIRLFAVRAASELERKRAEEALRDSEERYRAIVENSYDLIFETTPSGQCLYLSPNCSNALGYQVNELLEKNFFDFVHPDEREELALEFERRVNGFESGEMVCRLHHHTDEWRWFESHTRPFRTTTGTILVLIDARDITERKRAEEERLHATKLESVGVLAGGIAHDFNNILTSVFANVGLSKMLASKQKAPADGSIVERLTAAEKACLRARDLTKQLLTFAKGGAPIKNIASISNFIMDTVEFALRGSNVRCEVNLPGNLWAVEVDEGQMSQVIQNLIINADQAMPDGGVITVKAENTEIEQTTNLPINDGRYVVVTITDQGIGIAPEYVSKIFDPYFTTKPKGSGLGLATTYSIMKRHDGHITVSSQLGGGTTFQLYIPAAKTEEREVLEEDEALIEGTGRILIMDDEVEIRDILGKMLEHLGYEVTYTSEGTEAVTAYRQALQQEKPFHLAIIDLTIPGGMGGKETVRHLQQLDSQVLAVVSSGYCNDPVLANPEQFGFKGVITKPYNLSDLSKTLSKILMEC